MKVINLDYTFNTRDLGGMKTTNNLKIKENRLIRSGSLHKLSDNDIKTLKKHNLKIVVDFRSEKEFVNKADVKIDGVTYLNFPALEKEKQEDNSKHHDSNLLKLVDKQTGGMNLLLKTYKNLFISNEGLNAYKNFFKVIIENDDGAILWHCSQGKDRAGMASFLLEYALGVSLNDCIEDYLYTNIAMEKKIKELTPIVLKQSNNDTSLLPLLEDVFTAKMEYLNEALNIINEKYGSIDNLLTNILNVDIELLRK